MTTSSPLHRIVVHVETREECGMTQQEWDAYQHGSIFIRSGVDPDAKDQFAREDLHAAFRWCAGFLARLALLLDYRIRLTSPSVEGHRCGTGPAGYPERCGWRFEEGVTNPRWAVGEWRVIPEVVLMVPTEHVEAWADHFRLTVAEMLADDRKPLDAETPNSGHENVVLTEPATQPRKAST